MHPLKRSMNECYVSKRKKKSRQGYIGMVIFFSIIAIGLILVGYTSYDMRRDKVEQEVIQEDSRILCPSGFCYVTIVWHNRKIIHSNYDDLNTLTDSLKAARKQAGEKMLSILHK